MNTKHTWKDSCATGRWRGLIPALYECAKDSGVELKIEQVAAEGFFRQFVAFSVEGSEEQINAFQKYYYALK